MSRFVAASESRNAKQIDVVWWALHLHGIQESLPAPVILYHPVVTHNTWSNIDLLILYFKTSQLEYNVLVKCQQMIGNRTNIQNHSASWISLNTIYPLYNTTYHHLLIKVSSPCPNGCLHDGSNRNEVQRSADSIGLFDPLLANQERPRP